MKVGTAHKSKASTLAPKPSATAEFGMVNSVKDDRVNAEMAEGDMASAEMGAGNRMSAEMEVDDRVSAEMEVNDRVSVEMEAGDRVNNADGRVESENALAANVAIGAAECDPNPKADTTRLEAEAGTETFA